MKTTIIRRQLVIGRRRFFLHYSSSPLLLLLFTALGSLSCSVPNLESSECAAARQAVREFYSFHFGGELRFSPENLRQREKFLTAELTNSLRDSNGESDVFTTRNTDFPKTFRIGQCEQIAADKTNLEILLFWKDDVRSEQKSIRVETVKRADRWLLNRIFNE